MNHDDVANKLTSAVDGITVEDKGGTTGLRLVVRRVRVTSGAKAGGYTNPEDGTSGNGHKIW